MRSHSYNRSRDPLQFRRTKPNLQVAGLLEPEIARKAAVQQRLIGKVRSGAHLSGDAVYRYESSEALIKVMRDYHPIWRIRSWISSL
jgi:hypothetical protein